MVGLKVLLSSYLVLYNFNHLSNLLFFLSFERVKQFPSQFFHPLLQVVGLSFQHPLGPSNLAARHHPDIILTSFFADLTLAFAFVAASNGELLSIVLLPTGSGDPSIFSYCFESEPGHKLEVVGTSHHQGRI